MNSKQLKEYFGIYDTKEEYTFVPHNFKPLGKKTKVAQVCCINCGLLSLKNDLTNWATEKGCNHKNHPSYKNKLGLTNPFSIE